MRATWALLFTVLALPALAQHQGANLHSSRHFYAPTARTVPADSIYLNWVGPMIDVNFGLTDKLTAGIGTPLFTGVYGTLSYGDQLNASGTLHGRVGNLTGFPVVGGGFYSLPYAALTLGQPDNELTFAGGYFYMSPKLLNDVFGVDDEDNLDPSSAILSLGGYHQLNNRIGLAYEAWYLPQSDWVIFMPGVRFYTNRNRRYWNVGIIRLSVPYIDNQGYWNNEGEWIENDVRRIQNITLPMFSFATYL